MGALYRNDRTATFPQSWYAATVTAPPLRPALRGTHTADVCVIGAGFTGLSAARVMAAKGLSVIVLDAHRAGFGASGRNGGQVASGFGAPQRLLARKLGAGLARDLWALTEEAKADVAANARAFGPDIRYRAGIAHGCYSDGELADNRADAEFLSASYGYDKVQSYDAADFAGIVQSPLYRGGLIDRGGAHIHPLRYALALADAAEASGARIHDQSPVHHIARGSTVSIRTGQGRVRAAHAIIATNGYIDGLDRAVAARVLPLNSFIVATAPLGDKADTVLAEDIAVEDSKHFVNYYRLSEGRRLLFGGRASARIAFPTDIAAYLRPRFEQLFPQIAGTPVTHAWGGTLGVTATGLPAVLRVAPNILSIGGFNGQGVALSGLCGKIMGEAVAGQVGRFETLARIPSVTFPGGAMFGRGVLGAYIALQGLRERFG